MRVKFATQVKPDLLAGVRELADEEGRQLQSLIEEALADLLEKHRGGRPRAEVMARLEASLIRWGSVYERLAK